TEDTEVERRSRSPLVFRVPPSNLESIPCPPVVEPFGAKSGRGFGRLEPNSLQNLGLTGELSLAGWKTALGQHERENVGGLLTAQASRAVLRHRDFDPFKQIVDREAAPVRLELAARQARRRFAAREVRPVTAPACLRIKRLAALRLFVRIDAIPHRL